jgi:hypothetical protein
MWGNASGDYRVQELATGLQRTAAAAVLYLSYPGPKMIWQFGELGYDYQLGSTAEEGRLDKKPVRWDYADVPERQKLLSVYSQMLALRNEHAAFRTADYEVNAGEGAIKQLLLRDAVESAVAVANFGLMEKSASVLFDKSGVWKDFFTGESLTVTDNRQLIVLKPGEYRLYLSQ